MFIISSAFLHMVISKLKSKLLTFKCDFCKFEKVRDNIVIKEEF